MLKLTENLILLDQKASDKQEAIKQVSDYFYEKGHVKKGYEKGMLDREEQHSTYLGEGIAIPHGTLQTRSLVVTTGIAISHFPNGVDWGDGNTVYLAIGIAAQSDEHLDILKQLTRALSRDDTELRLKKAQTAKEIIALLETQIDEIDDTTPKQSTIFCNEQCLALHFPCVNLEQSQTVAAGLLSQQLNDPFLINNFSTVSPSYLREGVWLTVAESDHSALAIVTPREPFLVEDKSMKIHFLVTYNEKSDASNLLTAIINLLSNDCIAQLLSSSKTHLLSLLKNNDYLHFNSLSKRLNEVRSVIPNKHGLHARPAALLVAEAKRFNSDISVAKADDPINKVNAKNLMKLISLGVTHGDTLVFSAEGDDASDALIAINRAIESGLGEALIDKE